MTARPARASRPSPVDQVQRPALVEERRGRRVEVLRAVIAASSPSAPRIRPPRPIGVAVRVADREDDPPAEPVVGAAPALPRRVGEASPPRQLLGRDAALAGRLAAHRVPAVGRPAELELLDGRVREAAAAEIVEGRLAQRDGVRHRVVERDRRFERRREGAPGARPPGGCARRSRRRPSPPAPAAPPGSRPRLAA